MSFEKRLTRLTVNHAKGIRVDTEDAHLLMERTYHLNPKGYPQATRLIAGVNITRTLHRWIRPNYKMVDHINTNKLDNRRLNLRECTNQENCRNKKTPANNKSGHKGVRWYTPRQKWVAQIGFNGSNKHIGYYNDFKEAVEAYENKAKELFGEFYRPQ